MSIFYLAEEISSGYLINQDLSLLGSTGDHLLALHRAKHLQHSKFLFSRALDERFTGLVPSPSGQSCLLLMAAHDKSSWRYLESVWADYELLRLEGLEWSQRR